MFEPCIRPSCRQCALLVRRCHERRSHEGVGQPDRARRHGDRLVGRVVGNPDVATQRWTGRRGAPAPRPRPRAGHRWRRALWPTPRRTRRVPGEAALGTLGRSEAGGLRTTSRPPPASPATSSAHFQCDGSAPTPPLPNPWTYSSNATARPGPPARSRANAALSASPRNPFCNAEADARSTTRPEPGLATTARLAPSLRRMDVVAPTSSQAPPEGSASTTETPLTSGASPTAWADATPTGDSRGTFDVPSTVRRTELLNGPPASTT